METALESHVKIKVIAFGVFSFILVVVGIGYCLCNPKSNYNRRQHDNSEMDSHNYDLVDRISFNPNGNEIPKIILNSRPPFLSLQKIERENYV